MNTTEKLAEALREIAGAHIPDMPCAVNDPEGWRERHFNRLRHIARAALAAHDAEQALPLKDRPDFIAGYYAGLKDGRACERRDAAEQAAQAVPAGFKWVPVEPTEDMLFAAELSKPRGYRDLWAAMLAAAAPAPQAQAAGQELPPLPEPDGTVEIDCGPAPGGGREIVFGDGYSADQMRAYARAALAQRQPLIARARDEWHLDDGPVMWWGWSGDSLGWIGEPAWIGTPLDDDWPGYHTHWTPHPAMPAGATTGEQR